MMRAGRFAIRTQRFGRIGNQQESMWSVAVSRLFGLQVPNESDPVTGVDCAGVCLQAIEEQTVDGLNDCQKTCVLGTRARLLTFAVSIDKDPDVLELSWIPRRALETLSDSRVC
jgi:hypothetical protein